MIVKKYLIITILLLCVTNSYSQVPKLGNYKGTQEVRFTAFSISGSTHVVGTNEEYYIFGEPPYSVEWTSCTVGFYAQDNNTTG